MRPTRINWKLALATGTAIGAGFGGLAVASPSSDSPEVPPEIELQDESEVETPGAPVSVEVAEATPDAPVVDLEGPDPEVQPPPPTTIASPATPETPADTEVSFSAF